MKLVDELGILKCCKNCEGTVYCSRNGWSECTSKEYRYFHPTENVLKIRCAKLILERDRTMEKLAKAEATIKELNRIHTKRLKECRKLWKKQTEGKNDDYSDKKRSI